MWAVTILFLIYACSFVSANVHCNLDDDCATHTCEGLQPYPACLCHRCVCMQSGYGNCTYDNGMGGPKMCSGDTCDTWHCWNKECICEKHIIH